MNRSYSWLDIRSVDEDKRIIRGIATTPTVARDGDIIETEGIRFKTPLPFLYHHDSKQPLGNVTIANATRDGITVEIQVAPAGVAEFIDEKWRMIKSGTVRGLSMGWRTLEEVYDKTFGGFRIKKSEWLELSAVAVPADANAMITSVRSADEMILAALGKKQDHFPRGTSTVYRPGVSGKRGQYEMKSYATQIQELRTEREQVSARMAEMVDAADGAALDQEQRAELEGHKERAREIDQRIDDMEAIEAKIPAAKPIKAREVVPVHAPVHRVVEEVKRDLPPGILMARAVICKIRGRIDGMNPVELAKHHYRDTPEVAMMLRTIVEAGDTTTSGWASQLVPAAQQMANDFIALYRPQTIIGRLPLKQVPFNVAVPIETASGTAQWVGESVAKPVTKLTLSSATLTWAKAAAIVVITQELARFSSPSAEAVVRDSMVQTLIRFFDTHFVSTTAAVSGVSPAGILNGISSVTPSGTSASAFRIDMNNMLNNFTANNRPLGGIYLIMSSTQAVALSLMVTDLGTALFPNVTRDGGTVLGFPVIISEAVGTKIIGINASEILLASDPGVNVSVSDTASVEMDDAPAVGEQSPPSTQSVLKSFWQNNLVGVRVEQFITWKVAQAAAVEYINGNAYVPS